MAITSALFVWLFVSLCVPLFSDSLCDTSCDKCLTQANFQSGTYRIVTSGKYCLSENIQFGPIGTDPDPNFNWFPHDESKFVGSTEFKNGAYALGFFAAITIETDNVELDLNNFEISQTTHFYIHQRFFSIIEIGKAPFLDGFGPTNFGALEAVNNIYIHSGKLGLSSHHGIHSNEANNVRIEDLQVMNFEVGGIQMNGFSDLILRNINIGPSSTNVKPAGYYSNAKFLSLAFNKLLTEHPTVKDEIITFAENRALPVEHIYNNLISSINIASRYFMNETDQNDIENNDELFEQSIHLYNNPSLLPDGSALYGILLHSRNLAIFGFGNFENEPIGDGENVLIENVNINNLQMAVNEIPVMYFDKCQDVNSDTVTPLQGPFGDMMDIRRMIKPSLMNVIDEGSFENEKLTYVGNPLSDAQIALAIYGKDYGLDYGSNGMDSDESSVFLQWVMDGGEYRDLPTKCISFVCNNDIMQHTNKGIIGARLDLIEDVTINKVEITHLHNRSPLSSYACGSYTGELDGGSKGQLNDEGATGTDATGMTIYGGDVVFKGKNKFDTIKSDFGSAYGLHLMDNSVITVDDNANTNLTISPRIKSGALVNYKLLMNLINTNQFPYPNNFEQCNIKIYSNDNVQLITHPPIGILCQPNDVVGMYRVNNSELSGVNNNVIATFSFSIPLWINIYVLTIMMVSVHAVLCYYYCTMDTEEETKETEGGDKITIIDSLP